MGGLAHRSKKHFKELAMKDLAGAIIRPEDYKLLAERCRHADPKFPATYFDWQRLVEEANALADADNRKFDPVTIDVAEFREWCIRAEVVQCLDALRAFMIVKRHGSMRRPTG